MRLICRRNSGSLIRHLQDYLIPFGMDVYIYFPIGIRILNSIPHYIIQNLTKANRVGTQSWHGWSHLGINFDALRFYLPMQHFQRVAQNAFELNIFAAVIQPGFYAAEVEQIVDQGGNMLNTILDAFKKIALILVERTSAFYKFRITNDRGKR